MSIRRLNEDGNKWAVDYYPQGRKGARVREVFEGSESEALAYEMECRRSHTSAMPVSPKLMDVFPEWLDWLKLHRSADYHKDVEKSLKWLIPAFGKLQFPRITRAHIDQYKKTRRGDSKHKCVRAINKELGNLSACISWAVERGYANPLPFKIEKLPHRRPIPRIPHPVEFDRFLTAIQPHPAYLRDKPPVNAKPGFEERRKHALDEVALKKALILFMWECGLRWKEATHVRWEDIDWYSGSVMLKITKGGRHRTAALTESIRALLEPIKQESGWVFVNRKTGKPWTNFSTLFKTACKTAGIKHLHPHLLRHAFGTFSLEATGDLRLVQDLLGHRDVGTTQFYTQVATHRLRGATAKTADYVRQLREAQPVDSKKDS